MSIIAFEGFDLYGPTTGDPNTDPETSFISRNGLWDQSPTGLSYPVFMARNGGHAAAFRGAVNDTGQPGYIETVRSINGKSYAHSFAGIAVYSDSFAKSGNADNMPYIFYFAAGAGVHVKAKKNTETGANFDIELKIGAVKIPVAQVADGVWHYVEVELDVTPGVGIAYNVWVNGSLQASGYEANGSSAAVTWWAIGGSIRTGTSGYYGNALWLDDMYLLDANDASHGAAFQQRLGPIQIRPTTVIANGSANSFSPVGAPSNWEAVDESPGPNDKDTTYCTTTVAPSTQAFRVQHDGSVDPIIALTSFAAIKQVNPSTGVAKLSWYANDGTVQTDEDPVVLQNAYRMLTHNYVTMPDGSAFDPSKIEAAQWGIELLPDDS